MIYCKDCPHLRSETEGYSCDLSGYSISTKLADGEGFHYNCPLPENIKQKEISYEN